MGATLLNLREAVRTDYKLDGDANFPISRMTWLINQAQRYVQIQLNGLGIKKWEMVVPNVSLISHTFAGFTLQSFNTSTLTNLAESPKSIRFIEVTDASSNNGLAFEVDEKFAFEHLNNSILAPTIKDPFFWRMDNVIYLAPSTVAGCITHFYGVVTDLVADTDITEIPVEFTETIIKRVGIEVDAIRGRLQDKQAAIDGLSNSITEVWQKYMEKTAVKDQDNKASLQ